MRAGLSSPAYEKERTKKDREKQISSIFKSVKYKVQNGRVEAGVLLNSSKIPVPLFLRKVGSLSSFFKTKRFSN
jgi:predicted solute-binding protein